MLTRVVDQPVLADLDVGGLADGDARSLLKSSVTGPLDERVLERIAVEARGNPRALKQAMTWQEPDHLAGGFGLPRIALPPPMVHSFRQRLVPLPSATQQLLLLAAPEPPGDPVLLWRGAPPAPPPPRARAFVGVTHGGGPARRRGTAARGLDGGAQHPTRGRQLGRVQRRIRERSQLGRGPQVPEVCGEPPERHVLERGSVLVVRPGQILQLHNAGAEELGLFGAAAYADAPAVPLDEVTLVINLDLVGRRLFSSAIDKDAALGAIGLEGDVAAIAGERRELGAFQASIVNSA